MGVTVDDRARPLLAHRRPGQAVLITVAGNYGLPGEMLTVEWCDAARAAHDPDLVFLETQLGVPILAYRRVAAYARWHILPLTARRIGCWKTFAIRGEEDVRRDLARWEQVHPGLCAHVPAA